jgi:hypothetical protein
MKVALDSGTVRAIRFAMLARPAGLAELRKMGNSGCFGLRG